MTTTIRLLLCAALLASATATLGCDGDDDAPGGDTVDAFSRRLGNAACDNIFRCPSADGDLSFVALVLGNAARCRDLIGARFSDAYLERAVASGRIRFNAEATGACLARFAGCGVELSNDPMIVYPECRAVFTGTVATGGACEIDHECAGDSYCDTDGGTGGPTACGGVCAPRASLGTPCTRDAECTSSGAAPAICNFNGSGASCAELLIKAEVALGAACGSVTSSSGVREVTPCAAGLFCAPPPSGSGDLYGVCSARLPVGTVCPSEDSVCVEGAVCIGEGTSTCTAVSIRNTANAPCGEAALALCDPVARLSCDETTNTCVRLGDGTAGSACNSGDDGDDLFPQCNAGLYCQTNVCTAKKADGVGCSGNDNQCASGHCNANSVCGIPTCSTAT